MLYDGACEFCRAWIGRWRRVTRGRVDYAPYQEARTTVPQLPHEDLARAVHLLEPGGRVTRGAEAVVRSLAAVPGYGWSLWLFRYLPGFAALSEFGYAWIARHRPRGHARSG